MKAIGDETVTHSLICFADRPELGNQAGRLDKLRECR
jgi:hypothetical protein